MPGDGALSYAEVKILSGAATSTELDLHESQLVALLFPATMTGATVSFKSRPGPVENATGQVQGTSGAKAQFTAKTVKDSAGNAFSLTVTADTWVSLTEASEFIADSLWMTSIVSASNEGADRYIGVVTRRCI